MTSSQGPSSPAVNAWSGQAVGIVGLGLIGGSLGLDLQAAGVEVRALVHRDSTAQRARERQLAQSIDTDPGASVQTSFVSGRISSPMPSPTIGS